MKKVLLSSMMMLFMASVLFVNLSSCKKDDEKKSSSNSNDNSTSSIGTLTVNNVNLKAYHLSSDYWPMSTTFMFFISCQKEWEVAPSFSGSFWAWKWDDVAVGSDLLTIFKGTPYNIVYSDPDYRYPFEILKGGQIIVVSKDISKKQITLELKNVVLEYNPSFDEDYGDDLPADKVISGKFSFTYKESI